MTSSHRGFGIFALIGLIFGTGTLGRGGWTFWLWFFGIFGAFAMLMPDAVAVAIMMIFSIPIAILMMAAPFLFIVLFLARRIGLAAGGGFTGYAGGALASLAALAVVPYLQNAKLEAQAQRLAAADHNTLGGPLKAEVLALRRDAPVKPKGDGSACDEFCARVLLTGSAQQVIYAKAGGDADPVDQADTTVSYRLEERTTCPQVKLESRGTDIRIEAEKNADTARQPIDLLKIAIAGGRCLIEENAPLSSADAILTSQTAHKGLRDVSAGLDPWADTIHADRLTVHVRDGAGFRETYRWTGVTTYTLMPFLIPTVLMDGMSGKRALLRRVERINIPGKYYYEPDFSGFVTNTLGMNLALDRSQSNASERRILLEALASNAPVQPAAQQLADTFMDGLVQMRPAQEKAGMPEADRELAVKLLSDSRFPLPFASWAVVRSAGPAPQDYYDRLGDGLFARLKVFASLPPTSGSDWSEQVRRAASPLSMLPRATILKHRADLAWLARDERTRVLAWQVLTRLHEFGADAVPDLLWLIDEAQRFKDKRDNNWQHPMLAGMIGLCNAGREAKAAIEPIYDRLDSGAIANWASYSDLAINTLVGIGANPEEIWLHIQPKKPGDAKAMEEARQRFDREVKRAMKKPDCSY